MFDIAWSELGLIGAVALIVIGPKDLPKVMRTLGQWTRRARLLASEFQNNFDDMVRQAELADLKKQVEKVGTAAVVTQDDTLAAMRDMEAEMRKNIEGAVVSPAPSEPVAPAEPAVPSEIVHASEEKPDLAAGPKP